MRVFRKLSAAERVKLRDHLLRLSRPDRLLRFFGALSDKAVAAYCDDIDWDRGYVIGCFIDGTLRGVAELQFDGSASPRSVEAAVSVETEWRDLGIGAELLRYAVVVARNRGIGTLRMVCLAENERMRHVARRLAHDLRFRDGQAEAEIILPSPTYPSLYAEVALDGIGLFGAIIEELAFPWLEQQPARVGPSSRART
jgi:GNAT superfamily N-acetyltransferase